MAKKTRDLFDDTTMSFGEHLEVLRVHLFKAIIGLVIAVIFTLMVGDKVVAVVRSPIDKALERYGIEAKEDIGKLSGWRWVKHYLGLDALDDVVPAAPEVEQDPSVVAIEVNARELAAALNEVDPKAVPEPDSIAEDKVLSLNIKSPVFVQLEQIRQRQNKPIALTVQEPFVAYLKVSLVSGLVIASPWIFYQIWLFVAAGLYPHERKYVHIYLPVSIGLFAIGAVFCFLLVFPFVLNFLLGFNQMLGVQPMIRLSEWISFAIMLPVMFGLSFQLPLVMLFLERISVFRATDYREKRRMAIFVMAVVAMILTPSDPMSMMLMLVPLILLYELGILMCGTTPARSPFGNPEAA